MSNRGSVRGVVQQPAAPTVPLPRRAYAPARRPSRTPGSPQPTAPTPARQAAPAVRRERAPGGMAMDVLDERDAGDAAEFSWRRLIRRTTGIDLGPARVRVYEERLRERIRAPVGGAFAIAVLNLKGGVGKTSVVEVLGSTFAGARDDRVIAVDIDAGNLAERHGRPNALGLAELLADNAVTRYGDVRAHTYMNGAGLEVLGVPEGARTDRRLERHDVVKAFSILRNHYSVVLVDCAKALNSAVMEAVLPESRAVVVVTSTSIDAIRKTKSTLDWLSTNGYRRLLKSTVLAINHVQPAKPDSVALGELELMSAGVAAVVVLPFDRHVRQGKAIALDRLSKQSRRGYLEMAATLADMFPGRSMMRAAPQRPAPPAWRPTSRGRH